MVYDRVLGVRQFAEKFGAPESEVAEIVGTDIDAAGLKYRLLEKAERDALIVSVLTRIDSGDLTVVGAARHRLWSDVWQECLENFIRNDHDVEALNPRFVGASRMLRLNGDYAEAESTRFEVDLYGIVRKWLFHRWLGGYSNIFEFGSGSAFNLVALARQRPDASIHGLDWAQGAVDLANVLREKLNLNLHGRSFDFFKPDYSLDIPVRSAVMTFCALEQTGERFTQFLDFLLAKQPARCIHMEPIVEFYDPATLPDTMALRYHLRRGYLNGLLTRLRELEEKGRVTILDARRLGLGSLYHEGFSVVVWEPVP
jgi:hypothetical protein